MLELISQQRYRQLGIPVDIGPYRNHGSAWGAPAAPGTAPALTAISFPDAGSRVAIAVGSAHQWTPLVALRIEIVAKLNPLAARMMTLIEGDGAFRLGILEGALEARVPGPPGSDPYLRSDPSFSPDAQMHTVPANRWVTLAFDHDGYTKMQLRIDGQLVAQTTTAFGVPSVQGGGVSIGNDVAGGRPLLGAVDEVRIWRLYPKGIEQEFFCRPYSPEMGRCWEAMFRAMRAWAASHPAEFQTILRLLNDQYRSALRALFQLPPSEQEKVRAILAEYRRLWCKGHIDGPEMRAVLDRWMAAIRAHGLDPAPSGTSAELKAAHARMNLDPSVFSLDCDPAAARFVRLFQQAAGGRRDQSA